ncbi:IPT/TIG domain-containing protein [Mucilaginibacter sp.]|uniref:NHL domain-containing protein n=1 Tax=Mucilaginibacter sp. TaxID=1882438 RepID=UPI00284CDB64|nr:IPT/TIG domain-containing protein [Mucilaginibacter sp.]MDR3693481.1 IPT/TIG domain-containing protein [Mucilaginibacter sp.]
MKFINFKYIHLFIQHILVIGLFLGCSKSGSNPTPKNTGPTLSITSLDVNTGSYTTIVTINGSGFSATSSDDQVFFNGKAAVVSSASATQLVTSVPLSAGTGAVTVTVNGTTTTGPVFTYQLAAFVTTIAGSSTSGSVNGAGSEASFYQAHGIAVDPADNLYVADLHNNLIRKITPAGLVTTFVGNGSMGTTDGIGLGASFNHPSALCIDLSGNLYVFDSGSGLVRKITPSGTVSTIAGSNIGNAIDGTGKAARFNNILAWAFDGSGNIIAIDRGGTNLIRKITPGGTVTTIVDATSQNLDPRGIVLDRAGNITLADYEYNQIAKMTTSLTTYTSFAGAQILANGIERDGTGTQASFVDPGVMGIDNNGNIYVFDLYLLKKINEQTTVTTIAGKNEISYNGLAIDATIDNLVGGIAIDATGNIFFTDGNQIRKLFYQ